MTLPDKKATLINYLLMKVQCADWHGVSDAANDLREIELELRLSGAQVANIAPAFTATASPVEPPKTTSTTTQLGDVAPSTADIPHRLNEVQSLLRMNDMDLVEALFPEQRLPTED